MAKPKAPRSSRHNPAAPPLVQAAQIALVILTATKHNLWNDMVRDPASHSAVILTAEQQELLETHRHILPHLQRKPVRTVLACDTCDRFVFTDTATAPARCSLSLGCNGTPARASTTAYTDPKPKAAATPKAGA